MTAKNITRHSVVRLKGINYMLENKDPRHITLIGADGKYGLELLRSDTDLEVVKYPAQLAMDYLTKEAAL